MNEDDFNELSSRFIINTSWFKDILKEKELAKRQELVYNNRFDISISITNAQYYYYDMLAKNVDNKQKSQYWKDFPSKLFKNFPTLLSYLDMNMFHWEWSVDVAGVIIFDKKMEKVLVLKTYQNNYTFPKGKHQQGLEPVDCAIQECFEETDIDASKWIQKDRFYEGISLLSKYRYYAAFSDLDDSTVAHPHFRWEIQSTHWIPINEVHQSLEYPTDQDFYDWIAQKCPPR
ncbi:hydrolase, NUDIX family protein [Trichomonas vaginalis G3]|uniref:Hydrolase, NUDIX family protein n=1 Tax=Trichomonas vaginalis (strain ATCC PRA-98 / G3) TaxID=412133 RepID=A2F413_TRIV3|nr:M7GPPPN-mRNA hydrolase family [Trichomonas vaginalis G3]EAY00367.1 hydrolase, NUDIX family protein [Trichomonas vaginalis G3]KAI5552352.1 M7GPPPN-mRNA hydrolase family [Trichomonas vaginalis G3]|eukprot:XP_001313296.1 hydrolase, NUDIX family protein [Trichomonas vaginalis G3]